MSRSLLAAVPLLLLAGCQHHMHDLGSLERPEPPAVPQTEVEPAAAKAMTTLICDAGPADAFRCPPTTLAHRAIRSLARDAGEQPDWSAPALAPRARVVSAAALPPAVADAANRELAERAALNEASGNGVGGASFRAGAGFVAITVEGQTVGYVVSINDVIDHPHWDGSGVHVFYDENATVVADTEWSG